MTKTLEISLDIYEKLPGEISIGGYSELSRRATFTAKVREGSTDKELLIYTLKDWVKQLENEKDN